MHAVSARPPKDLSTAAQTRWIKADLHLHTAEDPYDEIDYSALDLLEHAHASGFEVLAVTLHDKVFAEEQAFTRAQELGILLIPAAELRIDGADVVILNLSALEAAEIQSFDDLRALRARRGKSLLVFAPHPFYRLGGSIGHRIETLLDCFDAIEFCHFQIPILNPNAPAIRLAERTGKPLLATSDAHRLRFFGRHYSNLRTELPPGQVTVEEVFTAIRSHNFQRVSPSGGWARFFALLVFLLLVHPALTRLPGSKRMQIRKIRRDRLPVSDSARHGVDNNDPATV